MSGRVLIWLFFFALAVPAGACGGENAVRPEFLVEDREFSAEGPDFTIEVSGEEIPKAPDARIIGNSLVITERADLPTPCHTVDGDVRIDAGVIRVTLEFRSTLSPGRVCIQIIAPARVVVTVSNLPPGKYSVKLVAPWRTVEFPVLIPGS